MAIEKTLPLFDEILSTWKTQIGPDYEGYSNHCYRVMHFCLALHGSASEDDRRKLQIATAFHDLGIWSDGTLDYLPPSVVRARDYLAANGLAAWTEEVELMIDQHHKIRKFTDPRYPLVEAFRKADLVDVSLGAIKFGLPGSEVKALKEAFPNAGFHKKLMSLAGGWFKQHPLSAPPFLKW